VAFKQRLEGVRIAASGSQGQILIGVTHAHVFPWTQPKARSLGGKENFFVVAGTGQGASTRLHAGP
jgi:hypothetical protein